MKNYLLQVTQVIRMEYDFGLTYVTLPWRTQRFLLECSDASLCVIFLRTPRQSGSAATRSRWRRISNQRQIASLCDGRGIAPLSHTFSPKGMLRDRNDVTGT